MKKIKEKKTKLKGYDYLKKDFENAVKKLQSQCKHQKKYIIWADECWAIGHYTRRRLKICAFCNKILETKTRP